MTPELEKIMDEVALRDYIDRLNAKIQRLERENKVMREALEHYQSAHYHIETGYPCCGDKTAENALAKMCEILNGAD